MTVEKEYYEFEKPFLRMEGTQMPNGEWSVAGYNSMGFMGRFVVANEEEASRIIKKLVRMVPAVTFNHGAIQQVGFDREKRSYVDGHSMGSSRNMPRILTYDELQSELTKLRNDYIDYKNGTHNNEEPSTREQLAGNP